MFIKLQQEGKRVRALEELPDFIHPLGEWIEEAFLLLSGCRPVGFSSMQPIPLSEIESYVRLFDIPNNLVELFVNIIKKLDIFWLELKQKS